MSDGVDIFTSRRTHYCECLYWHRKDDEEEDSFAMVSVDPEYNELIYDRSPDGTFYSKEISSYDYSNGRVSNSFMFDKTNVTIETEDSIDAIIVNDIVYFDEKVWRVAGVGKSKKRRQNQFSRSPAYKTVISLRR